MSHVTGNVSYASRLIVQPHFLAKQVDIGKSRPSLEKVPGQYLPMDKNESKGDVLVGGKSVGFSAKIETSLTHNRSRIVLQLGPWMDLSKEMTRASQTDTGWA